jgi:hypothetical protein
VVITTFTPATSGSKLKVTFSQFRTESCCDYLSVYNGPSTSSPFLGSFGGSNIPPALTSTAANGELTFVFYTDGSVTDIGWVARLNCMTPMVPPAITATVQGVKSVALQLTDPNTNELAVQIQRSLRDSFHFEPLVTLPANTISHDVLSCNGLQCLWYFKF